MKKTHSINFAALLLLCSVMLGCGKENSEPEPTPKTTSIYGTVFNSVTHEPVIGAEVVIGVQSLIYGTAYCNDITSSVSGSDGQYELQYGSVENVMFFYISVSCDGYQNYRSNTSFGEGGGLYHMDINLVPK